MNMIFKQTFLLKHLPLQLFLDQHDHLILDPDIPSLCQIQNLEAFSF